MEKSECTVLHALHSAGGSLILTPRRVTACRYLDVRRLRVIDQPGELIGRPGAASGWPLPALVASAAGPAGPGSAAAEGAGPATPAAALGGGRQDDEAVCGPDEAWART